jgi:4-amino-4-deoxy-L-arabinose transferase-like glycosyltransferase
MVAGATTVNAASSTTWGSCTDHRRHLRQTLPVPGRIRSARFETKLLVIVVAALAWRVAYVLVTKRHAVVWGDSVAYHDGANLLAEGKGFIDPLRYGLSGLRFPSAAHPPLYMTYLAAWSLLGLKSALWHRLASCVLGAVTVGLVGYLGRKLAGDRAGLLAALLAAAYPHLWLNDAALLSETAAAFAVVLAMLAVERFREQPTTSRALQLGGALALAVLGRAELFLLLPLIALPLVLGARGLTNRARLQRIGLVAAAAAVLIGPWVGYNLTRFDKPVYLSNGFGATLQGGSCDATFHGADIGYWAYCPGSNDAARLPPPPAGTLARWSREPDSSRTKAEQRAYFRRYFTGAADESERDAVARREAVKYIRAHEGQFVVVVAARIGRIWNVFRPWQNATFDGLIEGRGLAQARVALVAFFLYAAAAIGGLMVLRRRRHAIWPYLVLAGVVTFTVAISFAIQRYRIPVDAVLPALAAVGADALLPRRDREPVSFPSAPPSTT